MTAELQVRRGTVVPVAATVEVGGVDGNISSRTVTTFELDGQVVRFAGESIPFREGDEAIVAGCLGDSGIFRAYAIKLPRQNVLLDSGDASLFWKIFGALFFFIGCVLGSSFYSEVAEFDGEPFGYGSDLFSLSISLVLMLASMGFGALAWHVGSDKSVSIARALLREQTQSGQAK